MKKQLALIAFILCILQSFAQNDEYIKSEKAPTQKTEEVYKTCITIGFLQGGGSMAGIDFEWMPKKIWSLQAGVGFAGFGIGANLHLGKYIQSSMISAQYWHQGFVNSYTQSVAGLNYVFRGKKWFTFQIGLGAALDEGPAWPTNIDQPPVMLMYAIGGYIPW